MWMILANRQGLTRLPSQFLSSPRLSQTDFNVESATTSPVTSRKYRTIVAKCTIGVIPEAKGDQPVE